MVTRKKQTSDRALVKLARAGAAAIVDDALAKLPFPPGARVRILCGDWQAGAVVEKGRGSYEVKVDGGRGVHTFGAAVLVAE